MHSEHTSLTELINALIRTGLTPEQADILTDGLKQCPGRDDMNETVANELHFLMMQLAAVKTAGKLIQR
jgi:hypothetical protein